MGISIICKGTGHSIDLGCGGFSNLRATIGALCPEPLKSHYANLMNFRGYGMSSEDKEKWYEAYDKRTEELLNQKQIDEKTVLFLLQSDCEGSIRYGACKNLLRLIGDYDDDILYGYCGRPDCAKFKDFKQLLTECVETKSNLIWR